MLKRTDAFIQRHFDACVHWVMLTFGVSKGFVRYGLALTAASGLLGYASVNQWYWFWVVGALAWLTVAEVHRRVDEVAEAAGCLSRVDSNPSGIWKGFMIGCALCTWAASLVVGFSAEDLYLLFCTLGSVGDEYIKCTNPRPPEKRQRRLVTQTEGV